MSQLEDLCATLAALDGDIDAMARTLHQRSRDCHRVAQQTAATVRSPEHGRDPAAVQAATALDAAGRTLAHAAALLAQAAHQGKQFVARTVGRSGSTDQGGDGRAGTVPLDGEGPSHRMTLADLAAIRDYTGAGFRDLNSALRDPGPTPDEIARRADNLSSTLAKLPDHQGPVFRGATLSPAQLSRYRPGSVIREAAFTSTTQAVDVAFAGNVLFTITSRHGKSIQHLSHLPHEAEVLFDKGAQFYVARSRHDPGTGTTTINLIEV